MNNKLRVRLASLPLLRSPLRTMGCFSQVPLLVTGLIVIVLVGWELMNSTTAYLQENIAPIAQTALAQDRIYAYRDWQSVGVRVEDGQWLSIQTEGEWSYTPDDYHGPEGHPRFMAPSFYPLQGRGGSLVGRIGERGAPFYVGKDVRMVAKRSGTLYLRINDDMLSDNEGVMEVNISVQKLDESRPISGY